MVYTAHISRMVLKYIKGRGNLNNAWVVDACSKLFKQDAFKFTSSF